MTANSRAAVTEAVPSATGSRLSSLREAYMRSLKPLEVEEPIDVWVHRPLAFLIARAAYPTFISPNQITVASIVMGLTAASCMLRTFPHHLQYAGAALFTSAVLDCADGQLARMRGTSSQLGRMLDGTADLVVSCSVVLGGTYVIWRIFAETWWHGLIALGLCAVTTVTGSFHTATYDHYKNVFLRLAHPSQGEGEDYETALARYRAQRSQYSLFQRIAWPIYLFYVKSQVDFVRKFDPHTRLAFNRLPPYDAERAAVYRAHAAPLMRLWRGWFGFGSLVFGISASLMLGAVEYYMLYRLIALNLVFYLYMRPRQRAASARAFAALGS